MCQGLWLLRELSKKIKTDWLTDWERDIVNKTLNLIKILSNQKKKYFDHNCIQKYHLINAKYYSLRVGIMKIFLSGRERQRVGN